MKKVKLKNSKELYDSIFSLQILLSFLHRNLLKAAKVLVGFISYGGKCLGLYNEDNSCDGC